MAPKALHRNEWQTLFYQKFDVISNEQDYWWIPIFLLRQNYLVTCNMSGYIMPLNYFAYLYNLLISILVSQLTLNI